MTQSPSRRLVLLRHAKSAWPPGVADHERPLAPRGQRDAPAMGRWLRDAGCVPDQVLCSTARRARETWQLAQAGLAAAPPVTFERGVYEGTAAGLLALIRRTPAAVGTLLVIGHNPAIEELALMLAAVSPGPAENPAPDAASSGALERMRAKFPTAAIAVLGFGGTWRALAQGRARLAAFVTPRGLEHPAIGLPGSRRPGGP
jgi:phosphohistidine phosphatase